MIVESIKSLSPPCPEDVGTLPNLVKYCVDCFSLLFVVHVVLVTSPAASVSAWLVDSSRVVVIPPAHNSTVGLAHWEYRCLLKEGFKFNPYSCRMKILSWIISDGCMCIGTKVTSTLFLKKRKPPRVLAPIMFNYVVNYHLSFSFIQGHNQT